MPTDSAVNILYISYDGMTDPLGQSQVIPYLQGLSKAGYRFTLLSFEKPERFKKSCGEISELLGKSNIDWVPMVYTKKPAVLSTVYDLWQMKRKAVELHKQKNFKIVHCRSYISALAGMDLKKKLGIKFVFDMRGFYADERLDGGIWDISKPLYKAVYNFFKRKEKEFLSAADYTVTLTHKAEEVIHSWKGIAGQPVPIKVIPCCADRELFSYKSVDTALLQQLRRRFNLTGSEFVLSYLGSIGTWYLPDEMLEFFKCLYNSSQSAKFLFITGDDPVDIMQRAKAKGIPETAVIISAAPHSKVPTYLALSNWCIFFIKPVFSKSASSPTKQGEIMSMGIPHVCNAGVGDIDSIIDERSGVLIHKFERSEYEAAVKTILSTSLEPEYIRAKAEEVYSLFAGVEKYKQIYAEILK
ncbi:MAG: glycosyltransferase family 4 protein [Bacteroidota bacterium]|nr:glycosyltransferase family 4 protein [Bacteroidota bacterium]